MKKPELASILLEGFTFIVLTTLVAMIVFSMAGCDKTTVVKEPAKPVVETRLCINQCAIHRYKNYYDYWLTKDQNWIRAWHNCSTQLGNVQCCKISEGYYGSCN